MQTFLVEIIRTFELALPSKAVSIRREACFIMTPTVNGEQEKGTRLELDIKLVD